MSGIALDAESGLWLKPLYGPPAVPRIFPFDLLYLDKDQRVLEAVEVFPEVELPICPLEAESALLVPQKVLVRTGTVRGDRLLVCPAKEIDQELARIGGSASAGTSAILSTAQGNGHSKVNPVLGLNFSQQGNGSEKGAPEKPREPKPVPTDPADARPAIAITKVEIEKLPTRAPTHHDPGDLFGNWVDSPAVSPGRNPHSPAVPPLQRPALAAIPASASRADAVIETARDRLTDKRIVVSTEPIADRVSAPETRVNLAAAADQVRQLDAKLDFKLPAAKQPPLTRPAQPTIGLNGGVPSAPSGTTFTIGQFGMWSVSTPTAVSPVVPAKGLVSEKPGNGITPKATAPVPSNPVDSTAAIGGRAQDPPRASAPTSSQRATEAFETRKPQAPAPQKPTGTKNELSVAAPTAPKEANVPSAGSATPNAATLKAAFNSASEKTAIPNSASAIPPNQLKPRDASPLSDPQKNQVQSTPVAAPNGKKWGEAKTTETPSAANRSQAGEVTEKPQGEAATAVPHAQPEQKSKPASSQPVGTNGKKEDDSQSLKARLKRWLHPVTPPSDRRRAYRRYVPGVIAHYYTGGPPKPFDVADISMSGLYLLTDDRWMPGTMIQMTLQKPCAKGERKQSITVLSRIVRRGSDGVGAEFVMPESIDSRSHDVQPTQTTDRFALARFL